MTQTSRSLQLLHEAEATGELAELEFTPYRLNAWAYARWLVAMGLSDAVSRTDWVARMSPPRPPVRQRPGYVVQSLRHHPRRLRDPAPILVFCSGVGNYRDGAVYVNRLADHFAECRPEDTTLIEDSDNLHFPRPRRFARIAYHDGILIRAFAQGKLVPAPRRDREVADELVARLGRLLGRHLPASFLETVRARLLKSAAQAPAWRSEYGALFDRLQPRVVLIEDGCYGLRSHIIRWARERGIATAEYQHGFIGPTHEAYNYGPGLAAGPYGANFPDYLLTYGRYWGDQTNVPSRRVVVGNPHLSEATRGVVRRDQQAAILFVSASIDIDLYRRFLAGLAGRLPAGVRLRFRPHPRERDTLDSYGDLFDRHGIEVDREPLAYQSVADADVIIGDVSTLLYEALVFDKPILLLDHPESRKYIAPGLFPFVTDPAEVLAYLDGRGAAPAVTAEDIWASDWRARYLGFLAEAGYQALSPPSTTRL